MPNVGLLDNISIDELQAELNRYETLQGAADHYGVSKRTMFRAIKGRLEPHQCWRPIPEHFNGTFSTTLRMPPVIDVEGERQ